MKSSLPVSFYVWIGSVLRIAVIVAVALTTSGPDASLLLTFSSVNAASTAVSHPALSDEGPLPDLGGAVGWLNTAPLKSKPLRGKVVLVNFWTYSCINSLRELPYMKDWAAKYKDAGLVVIGVHTPEFGFEKERANVEKAVRDLKVDYPVAIDSDHLIWQAFNNEYWPANYIIDAKGRIRYHHFGEGKYDESERVIQELLRENGAIGLNDSLVINSADGVEAPPSGDVRSPETYVGYHRAEHFASPEKLAHDSRRIYSLPSSLSLNHWGFGGSWTVGAESASPQSPSGKIVFRFHSRDLHFVLGPAKDGKTVRFRVTLDGTAPGDDHGIDTAADGTGEVREPRMYQLIRQKGRAGNQIQDRTFEIEFLDPGVQAFVFTFG
jgi:thiol-disulfide isomerase/thioredoxin